MNTQVTNYLREKRPQHLQTLCDWLKMPSVSADDAFRPACVQAANFLAEHFKKIGIENVKLLPTTGHEIVYGDWLHAPGKPTILLYGHYDVQPADPIDLWETPAFEPNIRNGNIHARGSCDDKGQVMMIVNAVEAWLATQKNLPVNIKFFIEGDEESGPQGSEAVHTYAKDLGCDAILICDTSWITPDVPTIYYGLRGLVYYELTVRGAARDLHSGQFGNLVYNPVNVLCELIAKVRGADGKILIPGFYDDVLWPTDAQQKELASVPLDPAAHAKELGVPQLYPPQPGWSHRSMNSAYPTFDVCGMFGGYTGKGAKTVLGNEARAKMSFRIVPNQMPDQLEKIVRKFIGDNLPKGVTWSIDVLNTAEAFYADPNGPFLQQAKEVLAEVTGKPAVLAREGASIPIVTAFQAALKKPVVICGMGLPDDSIHSPYEKFAVAQYEQGGEFVAALLERYGAK